MNNIILLLSTLDLPFKSENIINYNKENTMHMNSNVIIFSKCYKDVEIKPKGNISVINKFYDVNDKDEIIDNVNCTKYIKDDNYLTGKEYGYCIYVSNYLPVTKTINLLISFPEGSIPTRGYLPVYTKTITIESFQTMKLDLGYFYFPLEGEYKIYPCHISLLSGELEGWCDVSYFHVLKEKVIVDENSWIDVSCNGNNEQIINYLSKHSLSSIELSYIYYKLKDINFYKLIINYLENNCYYNDTIYSYSIYHNDTNIIPIYLLNKQILINNLLPYSKNKLIEIDGYKNNLSYQHTEFNPFINPRIHKLKEIKNITNEEMIKILKRFYSYISCKEDINQHDYYVYIYYLLLEDRIKESEEIFNKYCIKEIKDNILIPVSDEYIIQFDYLCCYFDCCKLEPKYGKEICKKYLNYPIKSWKEIFTRINNTLNYSNEIGSIENREDRQLHISSITPSLSFNIENDEIRITSKNVKECEINYYLMETELLFSENPFVKTIDSTSYNNIYPNYSEIKELNDETRLKICDKVKDKTCVIEIVYNGNHIHELYNYCLFDVLINKNMGILQVLDKENHNPLPCSYVKVYSKDKSNKTEFYKDGYTDLSGRFDYASISSEQMDNADIFAILINTEKHGSYITQTTIPK